MPISEEYVHSASLPFSGPSGSGIMLIISIRDECTQDSDASFVHRKILDPQRKQKDLLRRKYSMIILGYSFSYFFELTYVMGIHKKRLL